LLSYRPKIFIGRGRWLTYKCYLLKIEFLNPYVFTTITILTGIFEAKKIYMSIFVLF